ncbi:DUF2474 family protein [Sphingomonas solaris]|uniref:DUF2474 family protein n=1 Tax=Alterirhizorhabdus solaris TaxID=2529389 RepID=A0A558QZ35_9SPHN|nr:DUF2474 family protein [Sphingomonas solaris]TVV72365.1 DUF2474 family protein [Sphingomonas solaris]
MSVRTLGRRIGWFAGVWFMGVAALFLAAMLIRLAVGH